MSTTVTRSYGQYRKSRTSNVAMEKSEHSSTNFQSPGWFMGLSKNYDNQETSENSENDDETKIKNLFEKSKGEIYLSQITCQTYTMKINAFSKVEFTDGFISALRSLHYGSSLPEDNLEADTIFRYDNTLSSQRHTLPGFFRFLRKISYKTKTKSVLSVKHKQRTKCRKQSFYNPHEKNS